MRVVRAKIYISKNKKENYTLIDDNWFPLEKKKELDLSEQSYQ